jgi:hypothetical protein
MGAKPKIITNKEIDKPGVKCRGWNFIGDKEIDENFSRGYGNI